jgi:hypothetical protein
VASGQAVATPSRRRGWSTTVTRSAGICKTPRMWGFSGEQREWACDVPLTARLGCLSPAAAMPQTRRREGPPT